MAKEKRVEILFEPRDYARLAEIARRERKSMGSLVREAVAKYMANPTEAEREAAWEDFFKMSDECVGGPVGSPEEIKAEIIAGMDEYLEKKLGYEESES